jgi:hypothetical protein
MPTVGSWWVASHEIAAEERVKWEGVAMVRKPNGGRIGGKLFVTDRRFLFSPHHIERLFRGKKREVAFQDVERVYTPDDPDTGRRGMGTEFVVEYGEDESVRFGTVSEDVIDVVKRVAPNWDPDGFAEVS